MPKVKKRRVYHPTETHQFYYSYIAQLTSLSIQLCEALDNPDAYAIKDDLWNHLRFVFEKANKIRMPYTVEPVIPLIDEPEYIQ